MDNINMSEEEYDKEPSDLGSSSKEIDAVGLIGGRSRGLSKQEQKVPEPLAIESVDEEATDYFSLSGSNLKTDRQTVTCTRQSNGNSSHSAFGTQLVSRGRIEWMIKIDTGHSIRIGVCGQTESVDRNFTETKYGYGYGDDGNIYFGGSHIEYNDGFKAGDIVGVYLNMDMNTLKFSVNGADHGAAFDSIKLNDKDNVRGYRLAVTLQHRPHKLTLLESTLYNVERRSPRPSSNQFGANNGHQRKLSYTAMNIKSKSAASSTPSEDGSDSLKKKKGSGKKKGKDDGSAASKKKGAGKKTAGKKGDVSPAPKKKGAGKKGRDTLTPSKKKGKKSSVGAKKKGKDSLTPSQKKGGAKKKSTKTKKNKDEEEQKSEPKKKGRGKEANWVQREKTKDKWEDCGPKLEIEKSSVSTKSSIKDGNSAFGKIVIKNKMKVRWDITIKQGDNIGVGICNTSGGLKTNKNKKLLTQSFTNDMMGYGYMGNDGGTQRSGRYKKYGEKFKAGDKVSIILDMNAKSLSFVLNGDDQGVAFKNLPSGDYRLAASFFEKMQKITLNKTTIWDAK